MKQKVTIPIVSFLMWYETCDESMFHLIKILLIELHQQVFR